MSSCKCGSPIETECSQCKRKVCSSCCQETVDGLLCGEYTQWGCSRKYTNCETCCEDICYHEGDMNYCEECGTLECDECFDEHEEHEATDNSSESDDAHSDTK